MRVYIYTRRWMGANAPPSARSPRCRGGSSEADADWIFGTIDWFKKLEIVSFSILARREQRQKRREEWVRLPVSSGARARGICSRHQGAQSQGDYDGDQVSASKQGQERSRPVPHLRATW